MHYFSKILIDFLLFENDVSRILIDFLLFENYFCSRILIDRLYFKMIFPECVAKGSRL